jgi:hypothetical protein
VNAVGATTDHEWRAAAGVTGAGIVTPPKPG